MLATEAELESAGFPADLAAALDADDAAEESDEEIDDAAAEATLEADEADELNVSYDSATTARVALTLQRPREHLRPQWR